jgi:alanyl-tRNA synthetase
LVSADPRFKEVGTTKIIRGELVSSDSIVELSNKVTDETVVILDRTPFYVESGGQIGDIGSIFNTDFQLDVKAVQDYRGKILHIGTLQRGHFSDIETGATVTAEVDVKRRRAIMRNHTATHLAHAALREVLGGHVKQSGSYVGPDRLRFDFSHHQPMTADEIRRVEEIVNEQILAGSMVDTQEMPIDDARESGATALFGEKYGETVRVVSIGDFSKELCGGTHVANVGQIGPMFITLETGIASGVRRLEAITGSAAIQHMLELKEFRAEVASTTGRPETEALEAVKEIRQEASDLRKEIKKIKAEMFSGGTQSVGDERTKGKITVVCHNFGETDRDIMAGWADTQKGLNEPVVAFALGLVGGKQTFMATASGSAQKEHKIHVGTIAKELLPKFGGRGGGKPSFAQGSIDAGASVDEFFEAAFALVPEG